MRNPRIRSGFLLGSLAVLAAACGDFPTEAPRWQTLWVVPGDSATLSASSFFPSGVSLAPDGNTFQISLAGVTISRTLGEMCGALCQAVNGAVVPKPGFTTTLTSSVALPTDVVAVAVAGGRIDVTLSHNLGFDPLRPSAAARGFVVLTATRGATVLARDSVSGNNTAFAPNTTISRALTLASGTVDGPIDVNVTISSPAGDPVRIDVNQRLNVQVTPTQVRASEARVRVAATRTITGTPVEMELGELDADLVDQVQAGALRLDVDNPFGATGTLRLLFRTPARNIEKVVQVGTGLTRARVEFTRDEIRAIVEAPQVTLIPTGTFAVTGGILSVRPSQALRVRSRLELTVGSES